MSRVLAFILTILVLAAALFTAVFLFVDLGSGRAALTIDLLFQSLAAATAIGAVVVSLIAVFHKQKPAITTPSEGTPAPARPDALSGPPLDEAESLRIYLAQMRDHLGALQTAGGSFPAAATNQRTVQPNLELPGGDTPTLGGERPRPGPLGVDRSPPGDPPRRSRVRKVHLPVADRRPAPHRLPRQVAAVRVAVRLDEPRRLGPHLLARHPR